MFKRKIEEPQKSGIILDIEQSQIKVKLLNVINFTILFITSCVCVFPILWILVSSFKDTQEFIMDPPTIIPRSFNIGKFAQTWKEASFGRSYLNTVFMGAGNVVFCIISNGLAGYVLSRLRPKGHTMVLTLILWTMMTPHSMNLVPLFMTFVDFPIFHFNLTDSFWPFWLMSAASPFFLMLFKSFFDGIPSSYMEAARIDGCSELAIYTKIILPLSKPVMFTVAIFVLNGIWGDFLWPYLILKDPELYTTGIKIFYLQKEATIDVQYMSILFVIIPSAIMYLCFQKNLSKGIAIGGVKG